MKRLNKEIGALGESISLDYLKNNKYIILNTNYTCMFGEIDIIAKQLETIHFIEVKTRYSSAFCTPRESVNKAKQNKIIKSALNYGKHHNLMHKYYFSFDIIEIHLNLETNSHNIHFFKNAFT